MPARIAKFENLQPCGCYGEGRDRRWCGKHAREILDYARVYGLKAAREKFGVSTAAMKRWRQRGR